MEADGTGPMEPAYPSPVKDRTARRAAVCWRPDRRRALAGREPNRGLGPESAKDGFHAQAERARGGFDRCAPPSEGR